MGIGHGHGHGQSGEKPRPASFRARMVLLATLGPIALATLIGVLLLYPYGGIKAGVPKQYAAFANGQATIVHGTVTGVRSEPCPGSSEQDIADGGGPGTCQQVTVILTDSAEAGKTVKIDVGAANGTPLLADGEKITVARTAVAGVAEVMYSFNDVDRGWSLIVLAILFCAVTIAVARWKGLAALIGVAITALVLVGFLVPALLSGSSPVIVGLVASSVILFAVLYLAHGRTAQTSTALLGTLFGLGASAALSAIAVDVTHITGLSSEETSSLQVAGATVPVSGLLLCGFIVGSLGVLNDVTVSQASSVWALADADPNLSGRRLFALAMRIGRDHIASAVYTLVLAYAGSALPIMLLFNLSRMPLGTILTGDQIAVELVRSLVGGIALALSVPITTAVAAAVVRSGQTPRSSESAGRTATSRDRDLDADFDPDPEFDPELEFDPDLDSGSRRAPGLTRGLDTGRGSAAGPRRDSNAGVAPGAPRRVAPENSAPREPVNPAARPARRNPPDHAPLRRGSATPPSRGDLAEPSGPLPQSGGGPAAGRGYPPRPSGGAHRAPDDI